MSYVFIKLMGSVLFEAFLLEVKKVLAEKKRLIFSYQEFLGKKIFKEENFYDYTMKEPERITPFRLSGIRVLQLQEFR